MREVLEKCDKACASVAMGSVCVIMFATAVDALGRYLFNYPIRGIYEITEQYLMVLVVFLGVRRAYREGAFIRVTFLADHLPHSVKIGLRYFAQCFSILLGMIYVASQAQQTFRSVSTKMTLDIWDLPVWPGFRQNFVM